MASLVLDTRQLEPFEIGARLDIAIAYPNVSSERTARLVRAACADQIKVTLVEEPSLRAKLLKQYPEYNPAKIRVGRKNARAHRDEALRAGSLLLPLIKRAALGQDPCVPPTMTRMKIDQIVPYLWPANPDEPDDIYFERLHSIKQRQVRSRYPFIHLAGALQMLARIDSRDHYDCQDLDFLRKWVAASQLFARYIRNTPGLENVASKLIDIEWIE